MTGKWTDDIAVIAPTHRQGTYWIEEFRRGRPEVFLGLNPVLVLDPRDVQGRRFARAVEVGELDRIDTELRRWVDLAVATHPLNWR